MHPLKMSRPNANATGVDFLLGDFRFQFNDCGQLRPFRQHLFVLYLVCRHNATRSRLHTSVIPFHLGRFIGRFVEPESVQNGFVQVFLIVLDSKKIVSFQARSHSVTAVRNPAHVLP